MTSEEHTAHTNHDEMYEYVRNLSKFIAVTAPLFFGIMGLYTIQSLDKPELGANIMFSGTMIFWTLAALLYLLAVFGTPNAGGKANAE